VSLDFFSMFVSSIFLTIVAIEFPHQPRRKLDLRAHFYLVQRRDQEGTTIEI
jgi:hypothetical protein